MEGGSADVALVSMLIDLERHRGREAEARHALDRASASLKDPASRAALISLAVENGWFDAAFTLYKALLAEPGEGERRARAALDALRPDRFRRLLDAIGEDERDRTMLLAAGRHEERSGDHDEALRFYTDALDDRPDDPEAALGAARALAALGRAGEAEAVLTRLEARPDFPASLFAERERLKGRLHLNRAEFELAESAFRASLTAERDPGALRALGLSLLARGRFAEAAPFFEEALLASPDDIDALRHLAACREALGRTDECDRLYRRALGRAGGGRALVARLYAETLRRRGDLTGATLVYARLIFDLPSPAVFFNLGALLLEGGRAAEALEAFEVAERRAPPSPRLDFLCAEAHRILGGRAAAERRYARALAGFRAAAPDPFAGEAPYPCRPVVHALAAAALGRYAEARDVLAAHAEELSRNPSDLLTDTEIIKGGIDIVGPLAFRLTLHPEETPVIGDALRASVFGEPDRLLDGFLAAQEACALGPSLSLAGRLLALDPNLVFARERLAARILGKAP